MFSPSRIQPRIWGAAPMLLAAALAGCTQQTAASEQAAPASAASAAAAPHAAFASAYTPEADSAYVSTPAPTLTAEEQTVMKRAQERWDALLARDFDRAWTYLTPAEREKVSLQDYKNRFGAAGAWKGARVRNAKCVTGRCAAFVNLTIAVSAPGFASMPPEVSGFDEEWVLEDGQWWYLRVSKDVAQEGESPLPSAAPPAIRKPHPLADRPKLGEWPSRRRAASAPAQ